MRQNAHLAIFGIFWSDVCSLVKKKRLFGEYIGCFPRSSRVNLDMSRASAASAGPLIGLLAPVICDMTRPMACFIGIRLIEERTTMFWTRWTKFLFFMSLSRSWYSLDVRTFRKLEDAFSLPSFCEMSSSTWTKSLRVFLLLPWWWKLSTVMMWLVLPGPPWSLRPPSPRSFHSHRWKVPPCRTSGKYEAYTDRRKRSSPSNPGTQGWRWTSPRPSRPSCPWTAALEDGRYSSTG